MAVVGGRGTHIFRGYNRAYQIKRQPGSTLKPIAVYTPALENGYSYDSSLVNKKKNLTVQTITHLKIIMINILVKFQCIKL